MVNITNLISGSADIYFNSEYLGPTVSGVDVSWEPTYQEIEDDKTGDSVKLALQKENFRIKTTLIENTYDKISNFHLRGPLDNSIPGSGGSTTVDHYWSEYENHLWGQYSNGVMTWGQMMQTVIAAGTGGSGIYRNFDEVMFVGYGPNLQTRTYTFPLASVYSASNMTLNRNAATVIPVEFKILTDISIPGKEYGTIVDMVA